MHTRARVAAPARTQDKNEHTKAAHQSYKLRKVVESLSQ
jgi:hypothetical protein